MTLLNGSILDISGGNGAFLRRLQELGAGEAHLTEFSPETVNWVSENFKIPSVVFDLNRDRICELLPGKKFDVIMLRGCIEFCHNLSGLVTQLKPLLSENGLIAITFCHPTLGAALRTQFDQYNMQVLRSVDNVLGVFNDHALECAVNLEMLPYDRNFAWYHLGTQLRFIYIFYLLRGLFTLGSNDDLAAFRALDVKNQLMVFKRTS